MREAYKPNDDLRSYAREKGIKLWQVADRYGIADTTLCRKMRHELPVSMAEELRMIIDELAKEQA